MSVELRAVDSGMADSAISQMITNLLATSYNDSSLRSSLGVLDSKVGSNTDEMRRRLRSDIEASIVRSAAVTLKDFSKLHDSLTELGHGISKINDEYDSMAKAVASATRDSFHVVREATKLRREGRLVHTKTALLNCYEDMFVISADEEEVLRNGVSFSPGAKNDAFFKAVAKVKRIYADCQTLLSSEDSSQTGMDIMAHMVGYLDRAYDKIHSAVVKEFVKLGSAQYIRLSTPLAQSITILAERPELFDSALNSLVEARQKKLYTDFVRALTVEAGHSKPIDFYAYDTLRYVGDIMAWIHSAIVGEYEVLDGMFEWGHTEDSGEDPVKSLTSIDKQEHVNRVNKVTSALVKPMRLRLEQVVSSEESITQIYKVSGVINFYYTMFTKTLQADADIMVCLSRLEAACMRQLDKSLEVKVASVGSAISGITVALDLSPPHFLADALVDLKQILASYESSMSFSLNAPDSFKQLVHSLVEPYLEYCNRLASDMPRGEAEIFMINSYDAAKQTLALFAFVASKVEQLDARIDELVEVLVDMQVSQFLSASKLNDFISEGKPQTEVLRSKESVEHLAAALDDFLPAATMESGVTLGRLASPRLASSITLRASEQFAEQVLLVKGEIESIHGDEAAVLFPRTSHEVKTLLAID